MKGERIILAGGSGFIGTLIARRLLEERAEVVILGRQAGSQKGRVISLQWDGRTIGPWAESLNGALAVVNLAGKSVNCHHTVENRLEITQSRVNAVNVLAEAMSRCDRPPSAILQAGGQAIYGDFGEGCCDENCPPGQGFLTATCREWEAAFNNASMPEMRRVLLRIGFVFGREGGAFPTLRKITKLGLGSTTGNGRQFVNWIHSSDLTNIFLSAIQRIEYEGVYNACGPSPLTNAEFMHALRKALHRPWSPPAPAWAVRIGAWFMGTDGRLALTGRCCFPKRLLDQGFKFEFSELRAALADLCGG